MKSDWEFKKRTKKYSDNIMTIYHDEYLYKPIGENMVFTVQSMSSWAIIVPVTENGDFIVVRQFRAGTASDTLEFPGGSIDLNEEPLNAALRELKEETGAVAQSVKRLSVIDPNPAFMMNKCNVFAAENCRLTGDKHLDKFEDTEPLIISPAEMARMVREGEFTQGLSLSAYGLYMAHLNK